jgi:hypothetical protein
MEGDMMVRGGPDKFELKLRYENVICQVVE